MEDDASIKKTFVIKNNKGLHTRPATELVKCVSSFRSQVRLQYQNQTVNAKDLLGILMLAASKGAKIAVIAEGLDAKDVVSAIISLSKEKFNIKY